MQLRIWSESVVDGNHSSLEEAPTLSELVRVPQLKMKERAEQLIWHVRGPNSGSSQ